MKDKKTVWNVRNSVRLLLGIGVFGIGLSLFSFDSLAVEGKVKPRSAKIREEANTTSTALASVEAGDELSIKGKVTGTDGDEWYQVFVNADTLGFIRSDLVEPEGKVSEIQLAAAAPAEEPLELAAQTDVNAGQASSEVEQMQNQNANVTGGDVNVRAEAGTNSNKVAKAPNGTALIVSGKATGSDGKIWYQVSLTVDGNEVNGFIRSDYVTLGDVIPEPEPEPTPEPEQNPEQGSEQSPEQNPVETKQYDTVLETKEDGTTEWYLYDMHDADREKWLKYPIPKLLEAAQEYETSGSSVGQQKIIIIVMGVIIILLALGITLLFFKLKDASLEDDEEDEDEEEAVPVRRRRPVSEGEPIRRSAPEGGRPVRRTAPEGERPVRRPVAEGERPVRRPSAEGDRPVRRPVSEGQPRPKQAGRPVQKGTKPYEGEPVRRQSPQGTRQRVPAPRPSEREVIYEDEPEMDERNEQNGAWRSKNFMSEDDEFEFEFLNMDDPNRL